MLDKNKIFGVILGISHFFTDAIASFVLTVISLEFFKENANIFFIFGLFFYFMLYNFIAFWWQIFIWYFLDKIKNNSKSFDLSKKIILLSFLFYLIGLSLIIFWKNIFSEIFFIFSVIFVWLGSAFFHIWAWNISLLSKTKKATILWFFASGWVVGLSFWFFIAYLYSNIFLIFYLFLAILWIIIFFYKNYQLENNILNINKIIWLKSNFIKFFNFQSSESLVLQSDKNYKTYFIIFLLLVLSFRSAIWTNYQYVFFNEKLIIFYLALSAFLWKLAWWILEDSKKFNDKYFIFIWIISLFLFWINSFLFQNLFFVLIWIFWITIFISPITIELYKLFYNKKAIIISYTFWISLILGYFIYVIF